MGASADGEAAIPSDRDASPHLAARDGDCGRTAVNTGFHRAARHGEASAGGAANPIHSAAGHGNVWAAANLIGVGPYGAVHRCLWYDGLCVIQRFLALILHAVPVDVHINGGGGLRGFLRTIFYD
ncbi:hypothetical protein SDC9_126249 [bioreactor metagenome]|uniref:Uncharacterized protein n=1 Tax=bioreactor metagenome TaxID=1076179 RepID=A0A645CQ64_9ZZZZ